VVAPCALAECDHLVASRIGDYPLIGLADAMNVVLARGYRTGVMATLDRRHFGMIRPPSYPGRYWARPRLPYSEYERLPRIPGRCLPQRVFQPSSIAAGQDVLTQRRRDREPTSIQD